ncbi:MAG: hypothetical protein ABSF46_22160 [Terriglobia bacterium]
MKRGFRAYCLIAVALAFAVCGWSQSSPDQKPAEKHKASHSAKKTTGPGKEMGKGSADIGKGVGKGTGDLAKGTAGSVGNLAHGNVAGAGASLGKGAVGFGKNTAVGTTKGVGKIGKGLGGEFKKLDGKSKEKEKTQKQ